MLRHVHRHFARSAEFAVQQHICLAIKRRALLQEILDCLQWILHPEQWTVRLVAHAFKDRFRGAPKANHQRMPFQAGEIVLIRD